MMLCALCDMQRNFVTSVEELLEAHMALISCLSLLGGSPGGHVLFPS